MKFLVFLFEILFLITISKQSPHIFSEKETCEILTKVGKKTEHLLVPAKINAENNEIKVSVVLCTKNDFFPGGQTTYSKVSVYDKSSSITRNNNDNQPFEVSRVKEVISISLPNNIKCTDLLNYTITLKLEHLNTKKPQLNTDTECEVEIKITHPQYNPPCKTFVDSKWFIDLTPLKHKTFTLTNKKGEILNISLCGPARGCNNEAGCKIGQNETTTIGSSNNQEVRFDSGTNAVSVYSSVKDGRKKKTMIVYLRCNWEVPYISNPKLINEGSNFKFEVQSSFSCVKMPQSCVIKDTNHHLTYDLTSLSDKDGTIVRNTSKNIRLNICGDLHMKGKANNQCHTQKSQVCEVQGNFYVNRGSIPHFEVTEGKIRAFFRDGHQCNVNETYNTIVDLICSSEDEGPIFVAQNNCATEILWKTPQACPKLQIDTKNCIFHSSYGNVNLSELYASDGFTERLSRNRKLVYNICGKLNFNCSTSSEVSACIIDGNKRKTMGWNEPNLSYINGKLQLKYTGEKCRDKKPYSLTINMICNYLERQSRHVLTDVDDCTFIVTIFSSSACLKHWDIKKCTIEDNNYKYDLSPLIRGDRNYEIEDGKNRNRTYYFNLCAPVISKENLLFHPNSMMSMGDSSVAAITERFLSLGKVTEPVVQDGELLVKLTGMLCRESGVSRTAKIFFECSNNEESQTIINNDGCSLELRWRTKHACPVMKKGGKCTLTNETDSIKVPGDPIEVVMDSSNTYYFSLCLEYYRWCPTTHSCVTKKLSKRIHNQNVQLILDDSDRLKTVNLTVDCDPFTFLNSSKGLMSYRQHLDLQVKTRISCDRDSRKIDRDVQKVEPRKEQEYKIDTEEKDQYSEVVKYDENEPKIKPILHTTEKPKNIEKSKAPQLESTSKDTKNEIKHDEIPHPTAENSKNPPTDSSSKETKNEIKHDEIPHPTVENPKNQPTHSIPNRGCNDITVNGKTLTFRDLMSKEFKSSNATYIMNFDGKSSKCGGLFCKNGGNILNFIEDCPQISYGEDYVNLSYSNTGTRDESYEVNSSSSVNSVHKRVQIYLRCTPDEITAKAIETKSDISVYYSSPKICIHSESSSNLIMVFVIIGAFVILTLFTTAFVLYRKNYFRKPYTRVNEESGLINHSKML